MKNINNMYSHPRKFIMVKDTKLFEVLEHAYPKKNMREVIAQEKSQLRRNPLTIFKAFDVPENKIDVNKITDEYDFRVRRMHPVEVADIIAQDDNNDDSKKEDISPTLLLLLRRRFENEICKADSYDASSVQNSH